MSREFSRLWKRSLILGLAAGLTITAAHAQKQESSSRPGEAVTAVRMAHTPSTEMIPTDPVKTESAYVIGPGDLLAINVWNEPEVTGKVPVRTDGKISVPLAGEIQASGLTPDRLQVAIAQKLNEFVKQPAVTVVVEEMNSRQFNVLGGVEHPGSFQLTRPTRVLDALAQAGGFRDFAKVTKIYVLRRTLSGTTVKFPFNYKKVTQGKADQDNVELQAGDTVIVP